MRTPGRDATLGSDAPQSPSPPTLPGGAVALKYQDLASACLFILMLGRRIPIQPPVYVGCGFDDFPNYVGHTGIDFYKTTGDVYVARSCGFSASGVPGANVYPAFPGCPHQGTTGKAKVIYAADTGDAEIGKCVILEHTDNTHLIWTRTVYMHLDTVAVAAGAFVATTDVIGTVGHAPSAPVTNSHLHFEVWEQRAANPGWRTAAELARMPDVIQLGRSVVDPEKYLPPVEGSELLRIASPPSPAFYPPLPSVELPSWRPQPQFPVDLPVGYVPGSQYVSGSGLGLGDPWWDAAIWKALGTSMDIYPFLDAPDGKIYVIRAGIFGDWGVQPTVWLLHSDAAYERMIMTFYALNSWGGGANPLILDVTTGQWIDAGTRIGHITAVAGSGPHLNFVMFARRAPWTLTNPPFDFTEPDPFMTYAYDIVSPTCFLAKLGALPYWTNWPHPAFPGCP